MVELKIVKSDNKTFELTRKTSGGYYINERPEDMTFTVKSDYTSSSYVIQKKLSNEQIQFDIASKTFILPFVPSDTTSLNIGTYVFDIQINDNNETKTVLTGKFTILPEVTTD